MAQIWLEHLHQKCVMQTLTGLRPILLNTFYCTISFVNKILVKWKIVCLLLTLLFIFWQSSPYCMRKDSSEKLTGNAQFEGYSVDLIHEISKILGFNYTFRLVPDGRYGSLNRETKEWDGMMKELLDQVSKHNHYHLISSKQTISPIFF